MRFLWCEETSLSGTIPTELFAVPALVDLKLFGIRGSGSLPTEIGQTTLLTSVRLHAMGLTGPIPSEIGIQHNSLLKLELHQNELTGTMSSSLGRPPYMQLLSLYDNKLTGTILNNWSNEVESILLDGNKLTGTLPNALRVRTTIRRLNVARNRLSQDITTALLNVPQNVQTLDMSHNNFYGEISSDIADDSLQLCAVFRAVNCSITGAFPSALGTLNLLAIADLRHNFFTGTMPTFSSGDRLEVSALEYCSSGKQPPAVLPALYCEPCPIGSFKSGAGDGQCTRCADALGDPYLTTESEGATSAEACVCLPGSGLERGREEDEDRCICDKGRGFDQIAQECLRCPVAQYKDKAGNGLCNQCADLGAADLTTSGTGASSKDDCICPAGTFRRSDGDGDVVCVPCDVTSMDCSAAGSSLSTLNVRSGWWRAADTTTDIRRCNVREACEGGPAPEHYCSPMHTGPYCALCEPNHYRDADQRCTPCEGRLNLLPVAIAAAVVVALAFGVGALSRRYKAAAITARVTARSLLALIQMALLMPRAYGVVLPDVFTEFLAPFTTVFSFDWLLGTSLACYGYGGYHVTLYSVTLVPVGVLVLSFVARWARSLFVRTTTRVWRVAVDASLNALLAAYVITPVAATTIFSAWSVETVDSEAPEPVYVLRADYAVRYDSPAHQRHLVYAAAAAAVYSIVVPLLVLWALRAGNLRFLALGYSPRAWFWETLELSRQLLLAGAAVIQGLWIRPIMNAAVSAEVAEVYTSAAQLVFATMVQLVFLTTNAAARPLESELNGAVLVACQLALPVAQLLGLANHLGSIGGAQSPWSNALGRMMIAAIVLAACTAPVALAAATVHERAKAVLRDAKSGARVRAAPLQAPERFHAFLSHVWATGQDAVADLKAELQRLDPSLRLFRDVDDLSELGALETLIAQSRAAVLYVSRGFFLSRSCRQEVLMAARAGKPFVVLYDPRDAAGGPGGALVTLQQEAAACGDPEVADLALKFLAGDAVPWHREPAHRAASVAAACSRLWACGVFSPAPPGPGAALRIGTPAFWDPRPAVAASLAAAGIPALLKDHSLLSVSDPAAGPGAGAEAVARVGWWRRAAFRPWVGDQAPAETAAALLLLGPDTFGYAAVARDAETLEALRQLAVAELGGSAGPGPGAVEVFPVPSGAAEPSRVLAGVRYEVSRLCQLLGLEMARMPGPESPDDVPSLPPRGSAEAEASDGPAALVVWPKHPHLAMALTEAVERGLPVVTCLVDGGEDAVGFKEVVRAAPFAIRGNPKVARAAFGRIALPLRRGPHEAPALAALGEACREALPAARTSLCQPSLLVSNKVAPHKTGVRARASPGTSTSGEASSDPPTGRAGRARYGRAGPPGEVRVDMGPRRSEDAASDVSTPSHTGAPAGAPAQASYGNRAQPARSPQPAAATRPLVIRGADDHAHLQGPPPRPRPAWDEGA